MSQEQIDALKRGFEAFNRGDWDAALEGFAEDVVQTAYFAPVIGERSLHGRAAIKRAWEAASEVFGGGGIDQYTDVAEALKAAGLSE